jgi:hypothetical protein
MNSLQIRIKILDNNNLSYLTEVDSRFNLKSSNLKKNSAHHCYQNFYHEAKPNCHVTNFASPLGVDRGFTQFKQMKHLLHRFQFEQ